MVRKYNILVLGETGSGKSTFINTSTNYFRKGSLKSLKVAIPTRFLDKTEEFKTSEHNVKDPSSSKTKNCDLFGFDFDTKFYNFIDTPGLSDTGGPDQDEENLKKIIDAAVDAGSLSAILIVINGTTPRLTLNLQNVFTRLRGCLPDVLFDNILIVFSNCRKATCNFDLKSLGTLRPKETFFMNNSAFSSDPKLWDDDERDALTPEWKASMREIQRVTATIVSMEAVTTNAFKDMKDIRNTIKTALHEAELQMTQLQELQGSLAAAKVALGAHSQDAEKFKEYTKKTTVYDTILVDAPYYSTICSNCSTVCHDRCGLNEIPSRGSNSFLRCSCISGHNCTVCKGKCSYTSHYHANKTLRTVPKTLENVLHDVKARYDTATAGTQTQMQTIRNVNTAKEVVENAIDNMAGTIRVKCVELKKICSGFNLVDELQNLIKQLETKSHSLEFCDDRDRANKFIDTIKQVCDSFAAQSLQSSRGRK